MESPNLWRRHQRRDLCCPRSRQVTQTVELRSFGGACEGGEDVLALSDGKGRERVLPRLSLKVSKHCGARLNESRRDRPLEHLGHGLHMVR